jgi:MinD-like ATPase involved in chromosome partitioning or flagellar assembly
MAKELLRMQMLAGIITESQYNEKMNEEEGENVDFDQMASNVARKLGLNPDEVNKSMDLVDEGKIDEDYMTSTAVGVEVIPGLIAMVGGIIGGVMGYLRWSDNAAFRNYVKEQATFLVQDKLEQLNKTPKQIGEKAMEQLVIAAAEDLQADPEFIKKAKMLGYKK